jgi:hypothetical protein
VFDSVMVDDDRLVKKLLLLLKWLWGDVSVNIKLVFVISAFNVDLHVRWCHFNGIKSLWGLIL